MEKKMKELIERGSKVVMNTYTRYPVALDHGEGLTVWDREGKEYLDFVAGIAVNSLGFHHKKLTEKIAEQAAKLIHCSNLYYTEPQIELAEKLVNYTDFDKVFFCNSGAEANEAALKLCRKYAKMKNRSGSGILTMLKSFHGRTYGAVTATGQEKYQKGLDPLLPGISHVPFNDIDALREAVEDGICGILMEVIQGEGGIIPAEKEYLRQVKQICEEKDILLIFDEVQTGIGRSGELFAYQAYGVVPDAVTSAKGLAGGVPIGALLTNEKAAAAFQPGDHASTFGGNSLATAAANVVIDELMEYGLLENVKKQGHYLTKKLMELKEQFSLVVDVRGMGLIQGMELSVPASAIVSDCIAHGLLLVGAGANVIRFVPALIVTEKEIDRAMEILAEALQRAEQA